MVGRALADCGQVWLIIDANGRLGSHTSAAVGSCHAQTQNGILVAGSRSVCDKHLHSGGKGDMVCNVGVRIAYRLNLCAASSEECCQQSGDL